MKIELNAYNIDHYGLDALTGNSREVLLERAQEAEESGYALFVKIPEENTEIIKNVFDSFRKPDFIEGEVIGVVQVSDDIGAEENLDEQ